LELIEDKNMKILCKNTARQRHQIYQSHDQVRELARPMLPVAQPCAIIEALLLLLFRVLARPVPAVAKVLAACFAMFLT